MFRKGFGKILERFPGRGIGGPEGEDKIILGTGRPGGGV